MLSLAGCASLVEQLKDDPAIVGGTEASMVLRTDEVKAKAPTRAMP
jgi:hypothetical protein